MEVPVIPQADLDGLTIGDLWQLQLMVSNRSIAYAPLTSAAVSVNLVFRRSRPVDTWRKPRMCMFRLQDPEIYAGVTTAVGLSGKDTYESPTAIAICS